MKRWIEQLTTWAKQRFGSKTSAPKTRPEGRRSERPTLEGLERREVLSTTAVHPFMTIPAKIDAAAQSTTVQFELDPGKFTAGRGHSSILLGLNTRPAPGSAATTAVSWLDGPNGPEFPVQSSTGDPMLVRVPVPLTGPAVYSARVDNSSGQTGGFGLDGFLAGDVDGDQKVTVNDLDTVLASFGGRVGSLRYNAAADVNQDGRVGTLDYRLTRQNLGATGSYIHTTLPVIATPPAPAAAPIPTAPAPTTVSIAVNGTALTPTPTVTTTPQVVVTTTPQVLVPQTTQTVQTVATVPTAPAGYYLVPIGSTSSVAGTPQNGAYYAPIQYSSAVPSGPVYTTSSVIPAGTPISQPNTAYSYSYNPYNYGGTPVYYTSVR